MAESYLTKAGLSYFYSKIKAEMDVVDVRYNTVSGWDSQTTLISVQNAFYIYTDYQTITDGQGNTQNIPGLKIGDGVSYLKNLPMFAGNVSALPGDVVVFETITQADVDDLFDEEET